MLQTNDTNLSMTLILVQMPAELSWCQGTWLKVCCLTGLLLTMLLLPAMTRRSGTGTSPGLRSKAWWSIHPMTKKCHTQAKKSQKKPCWFKKGLWFRETSQFWLSKDSKNRPRTAWTTKYLLRTERIMSNTQELRLTIILLLALFRHRLLAKELTRPFQSCKLRKVMETLWSWTT